MGEATPYEGRERRKIPRGNYASEEQRVAALAKINSGVLKRLRRLAKPDQRFYGDRGAKSGNTPKRNTPERLTPDVAERLLDSSLCHCLKELGILPTWHRRGDDGTVDPVGDVYRNSGPLTLDEIPYPVPPEQLDHVLFRKIGAEFASPIPPFDYKEYLRMVAEGRLGFGHPGKGIIDTDAMAVAMCEDGEWAPRAEVLPLMKFAQHPNMQALHYGSALFEGITCEYDEEGNVCLFDLRGHYERLNEGAREMSLPPLPSFEFFKDAVLRLIKANKRFIPPYGKGRLYIRPNLYDAGPRMKVKNSHTVALSFTATPIGNAAGYFGAIKDPIIMGVPRTRVRGGRGGAGGSKAAGNYGPTIQTIREAERLGLQVVSYLDRVIADDDAAEEAAEFKETNASNLLAFKRDAKGKWEMHTPSLDDGDILEGRTRALLMEVAETVGFTVRDGALRLEDVREAEYECLATSGTAAYINPIHGMQFFDLDPREDLEDIRGEDVEGMTDEQAVDYRRQRIGVLIGERIMFSEPEEGQKWTQELLVPEPIRVLLHAMEQIKRGKCDDPALQAISDRLVTKFSLTE